ncbi:uncharacterized protein DS421_3g94000 [Arachis hypogaea]|nr:uncharacterized protein DS421_3g94000 [Arachis hypogaea]
MEATEFASPTTIPILTCPLFGIGRPLNLLLLFGIFFIIDPAILNSQEEAK